MSLPVHPAKFVVQPAISLKNTILIAHIKSVFKENNNKSKIYRSKGVPKICRTCAGRRCK